jgi:hypothetical protein
VTALGQPFGVHRPLGVREHGQDYQAEQLVGVVLRHAAPALRASNTTVNAVVRELVGRWVESL